MERVSGMQEQQGLQWIERMKAERDLPAEELKALLETERWDEALFAAADGVRRAVYGDEVYLRGLIEFTN